METQQSTLQKQQAFLAAYAEAGTISHAAIAANVDRTAHYKWMKSSPRYRMKFRDAQKDVIESFEREARRRAIEGVRRLKFDKNGDPLLDPDTGKPYVEHQFSDTLLIFMLKALDPEKYRERYEAMITGDVKISVEDAERQQEIETLARSLSERRSSVSGNGSHN